jgi:hypothetical protein
MEVVMEMIDYDTLQVGDLFMDYHKPMDSPDFHPLKFSLVRVVEVSPQAVFYSPIPQNITVDHHYQNIYVPEFNAKITPQMKSRICKKGERYTLPVLRVPEGCTIIISSRLTIQIILREQPPNSNAQPSNA